MTRTNRSALPTSRRSVCRSTGRSLLSRRPSFQTRGYMCTQLLGAFVCSRSENVNSILLYVLELQGWLTMGAFWHSEIIIEIACAIHSPKLPKLTESTAWDLAGLWRGDAFRLRWAELVSGSLHAALAFCGILPITFALFWFVCLPSAPALMPWCLYYKTLIWFYVYSCDCLYSTGIWTGGRQTRNPCSTPVRTFLSHLRFIISLFPVLEMVLQPIYVAYENKRTYMFFVSVVQKWCENTAPFSGNSLL